MDLLHELETMAVNIEDECNIEYTRPAEDEIARWQRLFSYSYVEALEKIINEKNNFARSRVSDDLWTLLRTDKEAQGYSREAFEHEIGSRPNNPTRIHPQQPTITGGVSTSRTDPMYLVLLSGGPFTSAQQIQTVASLPSPPSTYSATSEETGDSHLFCRITHSTKETLQSWLARENPSFAPTFIRVSQARKDLASMSLYPTLGIDSTLPQHRLSSSSSSSSSPPIDPSMSPMQDEYPVYYFFYGTLADPLFLAQVLSLPEGEENEEKEIPILKPAHVTGGVLRKTCGGKYLALVDGAATDRVSGFAYKVTTREREEALRIYETEVYEVVRCAITIKGEEGIVRGLSFRFIGSF